MDSLSKATQKWVRSLHQKKYRKQLNQFVAEGPKVVEALLEAGMPAEVVVATPDWLPPKGVQRAVVCTPNELKTLSQLETPNQVLAVFQQPSPVDDDILAHQEALLVLDGVKDPGNLGTLIRLADWFGLNHVVCSMDCVDVWNAKVVQSAMGSLGRIRVSYRALETWMPRQDRVFIGADLGAPSYRDYTPAGNWALVMGSESHGIRPEVHPLLHERVTIPSAPGSTAESLNVGVAAGILLAGLKRS